MKLYLTFPSTAEAEYSDYLINNSLSINRTLMNERCKSVVDTCSFRLKYNRTLQAALFTANDWIGFRLTDDSSNALFKGVIEPNFSLSRRTNVTPISVEAVDMSYLLDEPINTSFNYPANIGDTAYQIFNADNSSTNVIWELLDDAGYTPASDIYASAPDITTQVEYFQGTALDETYRSWIDDLLCEYGHVFYFTADGKFSVYQWDKDTVTSTFTVDEDMDIVHRNQPYDSIEVEFAQTEVDYNALLYRANLPITQTAGQYEFAGEPIAASDYWPSDSNVSDIYQNYVIDYLDKPWLARETRLKNKDISLIAAESSDDRVNFIADADVAIAASSYEAKRAKVSLQNGGGGIEKIYAFEILGTALYRKYIRYTQCPNTGTKPWTYVSRFIHSTTLSTAQTYATRFARAMNGVIQNGEYTYQWHERTERSEGDIGTVSMTDPSISQVVVIIEKTWNPQLTIYNYSARGISAYATTTVSTYGDIANGTATTNNTNAEQTATQYVTALDTIYGGSPSTSTWDGTIYGGAPSTTYTEDEVGGMPPSDGSIVLKGDIYAKGYTLHNANYIRTSDTRTIKITETEPLKVTDAGGNVIHDLPDAAIQNSDFYMGHLVWLSPSNQRVIYSTNSAPTSTWTELQCITGDNTNVKGVLIQVHMQAYKTGYTGTLAIRAAFRPKGSSWGTGYGTGQAPGIQSYVYQAAASEMQQIALDGLIMCPVGTDDKIEFYATYAPYDQKDLVITQIGVFI